MLKSALKFFALIYRVIRETLTVFRLCGLFAALRFARNILTSAPMILRRRNLQPADRNMGDGLVIRYDAARVHINANALDQMNQVVDDSPSFSGVRELFGRSVYTRGFTALPEIETMVDLGANRGLVSLFGAKCLGARWVLGVEPTKSYTELFRKLAADNGLGGDQLHRIEAACGPQTKDGVIAVDDIMQQFRIPEIDFLKCDIEGGEQGVFLEGGTDFLRKTKRIALELHPNFGVDNNAIERCLNAAGFTCTWTDAAGQDVEIALADYLYASKAPEEIR